MTVVLRESTMAKSVLSLLLVSEAALAVTLQGSPQQLNVTQTTMKAFDSFEAQFFPDGKMVVFPEKLNTTNTDFIVNITPNYRMSSPSTSIKATDQQRGATLEDYPDRLPRNDGNFASLSNTTPIPPPNVTGMRGNGSVYDTNSVWIFNTFRLAETSQPDADANAMIGFEHNEDHYEGTSAEGKCVYKSIAVRYSTDLGLSWTRSVPIITSGVQQDPSNCSPFTGVGDFVTMWDADKKQWTIFAPEPSLAMIVSSDAMAGPGTWTRIDPTTGDTAPGFIGNGTSLPHPDLQSISGSNPSIIRDEQRGLYHMAWGKWGGGIAFSSSKDLARWDSPVMLYPGEQDSGDPQYPTLVGDMGDLLTTDGSVQLYFTANTTVDFGRAIWTVPLDIDRNVTAPS